MLWLLAAALLAQTPEAVREPDVFSAGVDVDVVNVDVVVTDRQGRPVTGLGPDAFELRVDGEPVTVRYFAGPGSGDPLDRERPLYVALYLDRAFLRPGDAHDLVPALRGFLHEQVGPRDRVLLAVADRGVEVLHGWTGLAPAIDSLLDEALATPGRGLRIESEYRDLLQAIDRTIEDGPDLRSRDPQQPARALLSRIQVLAEECARDVSLTASQLRQTIAGLAGVPGRTVVVYVGGPLPIRVGAALSEAWQSAFGRSSARWQTRFGGPGGGAGGASGTADAIATGADFDAIQVPTAELDGRELFDRAARLASANGLRFYALDAGSLRASAGTALAGGNRSLARMSGGSRWELDLTQGAASRRAFEELADATGGRALTGNRGFDAVLGEVRGDLDAVYSLGFDPPAGADGRSHAVEVRLRRPHDKLSARHRRAFVHRSADQEAAAATVAALLFGAAANPLGVAVEAGAAAADGDGRLRLPLTIKVPLARLALVAEPRVHAGRLSVFVTSGDLERGAGPVRTAQVPVRIAHEEILDVLGRHLEYTLEVDAERGARTVAVGVRDDFAPLFSTVVLPLTAAPGAAAAQAPSR